VQNHVLKGGIAVVTVRPPAAVLQIHFHIAANRFGGSETNDGGAKIRAALGAPKTRVKHAD
jgi:hypothetical protein